MHEVFNRLLRRSNTACQRHLVLPVTVVVPLSTDVRLMKEAPSTVSLQRIYDRDATLSRRPPSHATDEPAAYLLHREREGYPDEDEDDDDDDEEKGEEVGAGGRGGRSSSSSSSTSSYVLRRRRRRRQRAFADICEHVVPDYVLSQYFTTALRSREELWMLRQRVTRHHAMGSMMSYVFTYVYMWPYVLCVYFSEDNSYSVE